MTDTRSTILKVKVSDRFNGATLRTRLATYIGAVENLGCHIDDFSMLKKQMDALFISVHSPLK
jgi:hypothetical protein